MQTQRLLIWADKNIQRLKIQNTLILKTRLAHLSLV